MATDRLLYEESAALFMIKCRKKKKNKETGDVDLLGSGMLRSAACDETFMQIGRIRLKLTGNLLKYGFDKGIVKIHSVLR